MRADQFGTRDHKFPKSQGGSDAHHNIVIACSRCNMAKSDSPYDMFISFAREFFRDGAYVNADSVFVRQQFLLRYPTADWRAVERQTHANPAVVYAVGEDTPATPFEVLAAKVTAP